MIKSRNVPFWHFWNPFSGFFGGVLMAIVLWALIFGLTNI